MLNRSLRSDVRNPLLRLPSAAIIKALPESARFALSAAWGNPFTSPPNGQLDNQIDLFQTIGVNCAVLNCTLFWRVVIA